MDTRDILLAIQAGKIKPEDAKSQLLNKMLSRTEQIPKVEVENTTNHIENTGISYTSDNKLQLDSIAIIGIDGQFPNAKNPDEFWNNIINGVDCITEIPASRWSVDEFYDPDPKVANKTYCKWGGLIEDYDKFDPQFFNISPIEAELMDPQQRLFVESCWHCVEDAGLNSQSVSGSRCGVFVGCTTGDYNQNIGDKGLNGQGLTGSSVAILAGRASYLLNLTGPCLSVDTACSSSLVAVAEACNSLALGNCDLALAAGVSSLSSPSMFIMCSKAGMLSPDGKCFPFDTRANGFVPGEGVGVVLLKRLRDAVRDNDHIYGVISGWGVNQDGKTNGITAPSAKSQAILEQEVYSRFGINPETISMIETQGTGSRMGDPIEVEALTEVFKSHTDKNNYCALGSVKSNIGHLFGASGIASFIKMTLSLYHKAIPSTINFKSLNEFISLENSPFYINTKLQPWEAVSSNPRRGAVSAFGFSGTNAHIIVEEYTPKANINKATKVDSAYPILFVLSARTEDRLKAYAQSIKKFVAEHDNINLADMAYTLMVGRDEMDWRIAFVASNTYEVLNILDDVINDRIITNKINKKKVNFNNFNSIKTTAMLQNLNYTDMLSKACELWIEGASIDWNMLYKEEKPKRINLPTYPFERKRYWVAEVKTTDSVACSSAQLDDTAEAVAVDEAYTETIIIHRLHKIIAKILGIPKSDIDIDCELAQYGLDSINGMSFIDAIYKQYGLQLTSREISENNSIGELAQYLFIEKGLMGKTTLSNLNIKPIVCSENINPTSFPLSLTQKSLWVLQQWRPNNYAYNLPIAFNINTIVNADALKTAFKRLIMRHPLLGARMVMKSQEPICVIESADNFLFSTERLPELSEIDLHNYLLDIARQPFDLENGPLMKVYLFSKSDHEHILFISLHHIIFDGSSMHVLIKELPYFYNLVVTGKQENLPLLQKSYADYVNWQINLLDSNEGQRHKEYWLNKLSDEIPVLALPMKKLRTENSSFKGTTYSKDVTTQLSEQIQKLSLQKKVSPFVLMLTAFKALLNQYTGQKDIIVGTVLQGRPSSEYIPLIGLFTNAVIVRSKVSKEASFNDLLKQVQNNVFEALEHGNYPFSEISRVKASSQNRGNAPLIQVMFLFQNWMKDTNKKLENDNSLLALEHIPEIHQEGEFDITLEVMMSNNTYKLLFKYNDELFEQEFIQSICDNYIEALKSITTNCEITLDQMAYLKEINNWKNTISPATNEIKQAPKAKTKVKSVFKVRV